MPLLTTMTTIAAPSWAAVASSSALIWKPPSPTKQTTTRSGWISFAATAAEPGAEVAGVIDQDRLAAEAIGGSRNRGREVEPPRPRLGFRPQQVLGSRRLVVLRPTGSVDRLERGQKRRRVGDDADLRSEYAPN